MQQYIQAFVQSDGHFQLILTNTEMDCQSLKFSNIKLHEHPFN